MSSERADEARDWAADKRDFVADTRDDAAEERDRAADARDLVADARDQLADAREARLNLWEEQLAERARALGATTPEGSGTAGRAAAAEARLRAEDDRAVAAAGRSAAAARRDAATERRLAQRRETLLAAAFAGIAEHLYNAGTAEEVLTRIAEAAVTTVVGSDMASVTLRTGATVRTGAATDQTAADFDQAQYAAGEGPSLDALAAPLVEASEYPDQRWPRLAATATASGVGSSLSYRLSTPATDLAGGDTASLNVYAAGAGAFTEEAREIGFILAAHAALAARAVGERITLEGLEQRVQVALLSRDVIGQAKGILMERLGTTPDQAFDILRRASQRLNVKLREVALALTENGQVDQQDVGSG